MFEVKSSFIGDFKLGDNINFNLEILGYFYSLYQQATDREKKLLLKPMIIINISLIEAVLYDFHMRIQKNTSEGVSALADSVLNYIRGKKIDEFEKLIVSARKHNLFDLQDVSSYETLEDLRKLRNRIHIQNSKRHFEPDDYNAFTKARLVTSEKVLERVLKIMLQKYSRGNSFTHVTDFLLPWDEHYPSLVEVD